MIDKIKWACLLLNKLSAEKFTGSVELNFFDGTIGNANIKQSMKQSTEVMLVSINS